MKRDKYSIISWSGIKYFAMLLLGVVALASCKDDETTGQPYARIVDDITELSFDPAGGKQNFELRSNLDWTLQTVYQTQSEGWVDVFDYKGSKDGRFTVAVMPNNDTPFERRALVHVVSGGVVYQTIKVSQAPVSPYISVDLGGLSFLSVTNKGGEFEVALETNVLWEAEIASDATSWLSLGEATDKVQKFNLAKTSLTDSRETIVKFTMVGTGNEAVTASVKIVQRGTSSDADNAVLKTIAEVLAGPAEISDNICIEGYVTSNRNSGNFPVKSCFVQDASGRGLHIEFAREVDNKYDVNTKLKVHLVGCGLVADKVTNGKKISGLTADYILDAQESAIGATPVSITSLATIGDNLENTLVTLKNVEFAVPMGTYVNIDEDQYTTAGNATSIYLGDTPRQYGHMLRDATGNTIKLYTEHKFVDKFSTLIPQGSGDVTGIVLKRTVNDITSNTIRLRSKDDNKVSNEESTRVTKTLVQFGPFITNAEITGMTATKGTGTIKTSTYNKIVPGTSDTFMYWAWTYARRATATLANDYKGIPMLESLVSAQHSCMNAQQWWKSTMNDITPKSDGSAWIIKFSTSGVTGDLKLAFTSASSQTGPRYFTLEWAESETSTVWSTIGDYESVDWNSNYQLLQYGFNLPAAMKNKSNVVLRMRVTRPEEARNKAGVTIASGGTNRLGFLSVSEVK